MYQKAKRLAALSGSDGRADESLTAGCQAYLTAVNSLSLVAEDQQWILVKGEGDDSSAARLAAVSCVHTAYPVAAQAEALSLLVQAGKYQRVLDATLADPDVITLNAIRTEYVSALARLQLSQHFPELDRGSQSQCLILIFVRLAYNWYLSPRNAQINSSIRRTQSLFSARSGHSTRPFALHSL